MGLVSYWARKLDTEGVVQGSSWDHKRDTENMGLGSFWVRKGETKGNGRLFPLGQVSED